MLAANRSGRFALLSCVFIDALHAKAIYGTFVIRAKLLVNTSSNSSTAWLPHCSVVFAKRIVGGDISNGVTLSW